VNAFQPKGEQARWRAVYDILCKAETGSVVTYEQLGAMLRLDADEDRHAIQMAVRRAAVEHEQVDKRAIDAVPNVGYRIAEAPEHLGLARRHQRKAGRSLVRGNSKAVNVDLSDVDPEVRHALEVMAQAFALQMDFNRRFAVRQSRLEDAVREITETQSSDRQRTAAEVAQLRARVEKLERERGE
jgi:polyhydroxyalkanoate synthesis regulator phasin